MEKTLKNTGAIKAILLVMVVLGHSVAFWSGNWFTRNPEYVSKALSIFYDWVGTFHVYAFTFVSGYIFSYKVKNGSYNQFGLFFLNKTKRLLIPYFFVAITWVIPISIYFFNWDLKYVLLNFGLGCGPSQLWFLLMLFDVFMIMWVVRKKIEKYGIKAAWVFVIIYIFGLGALALHIPNIMQIFTACQHLLFFYFGMIFQSNNNINRVSRKFGERKICWLLFVLDFILFSLWYLYKSSGFDNKVIYYSLELFLHIIGVLMAFCTLDYLLKTRYHDNALIMSIKEYSMPVFLFHQQFIYFSISILNRKIPVIANIIINFIFAITASFILGYMLKCNQYTKRLIGEK